MKNPWTVTVTVTEGPEAVMEGPEAVKNRPDAGLLGDEDSTRLLSSILLGLGLLASLLVLHLQTTTGQTEARRVGLMGGQGMARQNVQTHTYCPFQHWKDSIQKLLFLYTSPLVHLVL